MKVALLFLLIGTISFAATFSTISRRTPPKRPVI
jgi:hypothetical protein